jgi:hypothetical protein
MNDKEKKFWALAVKLLFQRIKEGLAGHGLDGTNTFFAV